MNASTGVPTGIAAQARPGGPDTGNVRRRRLEMIPLRGLGAPYAETQPRQPGDSSTPAELSDLISSIAEIGVLHPVLVEERLADDSQRPKLRVVAGERRLRACRWGAVHLPDNPNFNAIPAIISPGPVPPEERRKWQLVENLAREPLRPGEQAAALLLHRSAILAGKLLRAARPVPVGVYDIDDPVERFQALEKIRAGDAECAAPWSEVLSRLGLQLTPRKARQIVRAFAELPRELSAEMDEEQIALHTRIRFAQLRQGREAAAGQIWAAVKDRKRADLLPAAVQASLDNPALEPDSALDAAEALHEAANAARSAKLARPGPEHAVPGGTSADRAIVQTALGALRDLVAELLEGRYPSRFDLGSLRLLIEELTRLLAVPGASS